MFFRETLANPSSAVPHCHCPSLAFTPAGDLLVAWYAYPAEETRDAVLILARRRPGRSHFDNPKRILSQFQSSLGNPVLFHDGKDRVHLLFVALKGRYWDSATLMRSHSDDGGTTWSTPESLRTPDGMMIRHAPVIRRNGYFLLPAYDENEKQTVLMTAGPDGDGWMEVERLQDTATMQGTITRQGEADLCMMLRPGGEDRICFRSISGDDGRTWSPVVRTPLPNPLSGIASFQAGDTLCVVYNHTSEHRRYPLSLAWSKNRGTSWSDPVHIDETEHEVSYPAFVTDDRGVAHGVYTCGRTRIQYVRFDQGWWER